MIMSNKLEFSHWFIIWSMCKKIAHAPYFIIDRIYNIMYVI